MKSSCQNKENIFNSSSSCNSFKNSKHLDYKKTHYHNNSRGEGAQWQHLDFSAPLPCALLTEHSMSSLSCEQVYWTPSILWPLICYFGRKWGKQHKCISFLLLIFLFPMQEETEHALKLFLFGKKFCIASCLGSCWFFFFLACFLNPFFWGKNPSEREK